MGKRSMTREMQPANGEGAASEASQRGIRWEAIAVVVALPTAIATLLTIGVFFGWWVPATPPSSISNSERPSIPEPTPASPGPDPHCLAYTGPDEEPAGYEEIDEQYFSPVSCLDPHQFEVVARADDVACDEAVYALIGSREIPGLNRMKIADYGPYSCAIGRITGTALQTDTFRISTSPDMLAAFGTCIELEDVDTFLSGSQDYEHNVPCATGKALAILVHINGMTPEEICADQAERIPNVGVRSAPYATTDVTGQPATGAACAINIVGVRPS